METKNRIKKLRSNIGITQLLMSKELDISLRTYQFYEQGLRKPSIKILDRLIKLALKYNIKITKDDIRPCE
jgi:DNA-binding XRE family transcriptional regulator